MNPWGHDSRHFILTVPSTILFRHGTEGSHEIALRLRELSVLLQTEVIFCLGVTFSNNFL